MKDKQEKGDEMSRFLSDISYEFVELSPILSNDYLLNCFHGKPESLCNSWLDSFWKTYGAIDDEIFIVPSDISPDLDGPMPSFD